MQDTDSLAGVASRVTFEFGLPLSYQDDSNGGDFARTKELSKSILDPYSDEGGVT